MSSRGTKCSNRRLPAQPGPFSGPYIPYPDPFSAEDHRLLELHEQAAETAALREETRGEELRERRRRARAEGRRAGTVSARWHPAGAALTCGSPGGWLRAAGFEVGRGVEVEVRSGRLVIRAL
ncbi:MAG TPA: SymE family type I addiction module toxin [Thermoanaerobaculia bacterium]|nr:SymE family type I addiction module toxin [Thermoanaerobaculia bacterium]